MEALKEMGVFEDVITSSKNSLVQQAIEEGRVAIGYNCCMVPAPLLSVGKLFPVHLRAPEVQSTESADFYLSQFNCSYSRSILQAGLDGTYDWLGGLVFAASCVHTQRVEHNLKLLGVNAGKENYLSYVIDTPRKVFPAGMYALEEDLRALGGALSEHYGVDTSDGAVTAAIKEYNEFNVVLKSIADLRLAAHPQITGTEWHTVVTACQAAPRDLLIKSLKALKKALDKRESFMEDVPRVMVMGSRFDNPAFTQLIEDQGCIVVADRYCFGSLPGLEPVPEDGNSYANLAHHFMEHSDCPRMIEMFDDRIEHMLDWVTEYKVDGVMLEVMKFCDLWGWEVIKLDTACEEAGIPTVRFEREYQLSGEGQMRTRAQAFVESVNMKKLNADLSLRAE
jgi:benzoyl-CoA reductase/2-hydroxyglutaryl-CoA dehydratase subunit BcrC/BadD/HgdB